MMKSDEWVKCPKCGVMIPPTWAYHEKCGWKKEDDRKPISIEAIPLMLNSYSVALGTMSRDLSEMAKSIRKPDTRK